MHGAMDVVAHAARAFGHAGLGGGESWRDALQALALATGSRAGQLIGLGAPTAVPFNYMPDMPDGLAEEFVAVGGGDPRINPRVRAGLKAPVMASVAEADFDEPGREPASIYTDLVARHDIPFICLTTLVRDEGATIGLSALRSSRDGHISGEQRRAFEALAPHARRAVETEIHMRDHGAMVLAGSLDALDIEAFVVDAFGRIRAMSRSAEARLEAQVHLQARGRRLTACDPEAARALQAAIHQAAGPWALAPPSPYVVARPAGVGEPLVLEVGPVARGLSAFGDGMALVIARAPNRLQTRLGGLSLALFGLTPTEAVVASALASGRSPQAVADSMNVSIGTVRTHIRRVFDKAGVHSLLELASRFMGRV